MVLGGEVLPERQNPAMHLAEKIPFINPQKNFMGVNNVRTNIRF